MKHSPKIPSLWEIKFHSPNTLEGVEFRFYPDDEPHGHSELELRALEAFLRIKKSCQEIEKQYLSTAEEIPIGEKVDIVVNTLRDLNELIFYFNQIMEEVNPDEEQEEEESF